MAQHGDSPLAIAFLHFPRKTGFMVTINRIEPWGSAMLRVKGAHAAV